MEPDHRVWEYGIRGEAAVDPKQGLTESGNPGPCKATTSLRIDRPKQAAEELSKVLSDIPSSSNGLNSLTAALLSPHHYLLHSPCRLPDTQILRSATLYVRTAISTDGVVCSACMYQDLNRELLSVQELAAYYHDSRCKLEMALAGEKRRNATG